MTNSLPENLLFQISERDLLWQGNTVLRNLDIGIRSGEKVALIGESGAGKSTLLKALYQQRPEETAFCQQTPALVPNLSLFHNIYMGQLAEHNFLYNALNLFFPQKAAKQKVSGVAQDMGLQNLLKARAETLSGGQQQRAALARTLIQEKEIFLGDEPVSALDEIQAERLISSIIRSHNTVLLALHNTKLALKYCQRIIGLKNGEVVLDAQVDKLTVEDLRAIYSEHEFEQCLNETLKGSTAHSSGKRPGLKLCR